MMICFMLVGGIFAKISLPGAFALEQQAILLLHLNSASNHTSPEEDHLPHPHLRQGYPVDPLHSMDQVTIDGFAAYTKYSFFSCSCLTILSFSFKCV